MSTLRIFLADDHAVVREGLKRLIDAEADMTVVGEAGDGENAVARIIALQPHIVVLDVSLPVLNGAGVAHRLRQAAPEVKIVVLTVHEDKSYSRELLEAGALGYILKRAAADELIRAIRAVAGGTVHVDPRLGNPTGDAPAGPPQETEPAEKLSERELSVLRLIAQGYSNKEIASKMDLSVKTIETYKTRSMDKLQLRSRVDIVRHANKQGWLQDC